ncbi:MAG: UDP-N-acetylmuramoyl-L-alanyl-D-glutamate--2,6-diaminopimelate ligase, partial [Armatimonadetes bacterium]
MKKQLAEFWQIFKKTPLGRLIRFLSPQWLVDFLEHFPVAVLANIIYGFPSRKLTVIGITGTDGKTTTTNMIYRVLKDAGLKVSMVSTINAVLGNKIYDTGFHVTSPHSFTIQEFIKKAVNSGSEYLVLEVTSHGLDQHRFWGVQFDIGIITNITHEHLDYHKNFQNYVRAKSRLLKNVKTAVLNYDDPSFKKLRESAGGKVMSFGWSKQADWNAENFPLKLKIPGDYNIENALAAAVVASSVGIEKKVIKKSLERFTSLSGRMEEIENNRGVKIIVDFAHTPNALEKVLVTLHSDTRSKLISVFGCAGARDKGKRPLMGAVSAKYADITILTDEDPRFEDRESIIDDIAAGAYQQKAIDGKTLFREPDRFKAIKLALEMAKKGDTVGIFGKGHEQS